MAFTGNSARADATPLAALARDGDLSLVSVRCRPVSVGGVAFDDYVFETEALAAGDAMLERGFSADRSVIAVASVPWRQMPMSWTALQSRDGRDHLELFEEMDPVGHDVFDDAFAVDDDDASAFRRAFPTSLREWIVDFDARHGPLIVIFDGHPVVHVDATDGDTDDDGRDGRGQTPAVRKAGAVTVRGSDRPTSAIFVAREVIGDAAFVETIDIATAFAGHCCDTIRR